jgi:NAD(P)-dependent dehydrogenase (short-subunit alcohol dehydrogenase family)
MGRVAGKIAVITGAAMGIGAATARALAREGACAILADIAVDQGERVAAEIRAAGGAARFTRLDVTSEDDWRSLGELVMRDCRRLDVHVNCAGVYLGKPIVETSLEEFRRVNRVNVEGTFLGTKLAVRLMTESAAPGEPPRGSIVNLSSILGQVGMANASAYCASKGAVRILSKSVAVECGARRDQIRVNSVHPGFVRTPMAETVTGPDVWRAGHPLFAQVPLRTFAEAEEIAAAIVYLASEESRFITGAEITIDGGATAL